MQPSSVQATLYTHYREVHKRLMNPPRVIPPEVLQAKIDERRWREKEKKRLHHNKLRREAAARKRKLLGPISPAGRRSLNGIAREIAPKYGTTVEEMQGPSRARNMICCRAEFVKAVNFYKPKVTYADIGRFLNKDHTTVLHMAGRLTAKPQPECIKQLMKYLGTIYVTKTEFGGVYRGQIAAQ